ncbi:MAG TPA: TonB-dependent receptor [Candidatus Acidoferrales bacterium]|nr:TonB-dependent receptor [Candidatus Acidoferrales bacterium]
MRRRHFFHLLLGTWFLSFAAYPIVSHAQSNATIRGKTTDPTGAVVAGAAITAQSLYSAGTTARTQSGQDGGFSLTLTPGRYRVSIERASFERIEQEFTLASGETQTWDARLELATMSSSVIVTDTATPVTSQTTPDLVEVITKEQIDERQELFLADLLASAQGASFSRLGPMGGVTSFFLDGGNSNFTKLLVDGTPVNEPGGDIDLSNYTLEDVEKIEIAHGASSALYGSDAMDGVVQIFTHRGRTRTPELTLDGDAGTFGTGRGAVQLSGLLGLFDYALGGSYLATDGQGPDDSYRDGTVSGNFGWKLSDSDSLRLAIRNSASDAGQPGQTLLGPAFTDLNQSSALHDFSANLNWDFAVGPHWNFRATGYESRFQDFGIFAPGAFGFFVDKFNRAGFDELATYSFRGGIVSAGYMSEVETGDQNHRDNQAGYAEVRYLLWRRLTVTAGGRAEDNASFGTRVVPRVGGSYAVREGGDVWGPTRLRASYGLGIKEPNFGQSFSSDPCFPGNPNLKPEQSTTFEAGIDQAFASNRVKLSITYFHNDFYDIVSFAGGPPTELCQFGTGTFFNTDKARAFGSNSSFEIKATRWLNIAGNYTYDDTKVLKSPNATDPALIPGNRLLKRPLNSGNLIFSARERGMTFNLIGTYVGRRTDSDFDGLGITSDPGYFRMDLAAIMPLRYGLSMTAHFGNLLDRHYQEAVGYPALGYNYRLGLRYVWGGER